MEIPGKYRSKHINNYVSEKIQKNVLIYWINSKKCAKLYSIMSKEF